MAYFSRGKNRISDIIPFMESYDFFISKPSGNTKTHITKQLYKQIIVEFYKAVMYEVMYKNKTFKFPYRMGKFRILKRPENFKNMGDRLVDWKTSVDIHKKVYHLNEHSGGYKYNFYWVKEGTDVKNLYFYRLEMSRANKRLLAKLIKSGNYDYYEK